jgi:hypothetical protein
VDLDDAAMMRLDESLVAGAKNAYYFTYWDYFSHFMSLVM